jgi:inorganic pyrophosphatase/exopolyphosphatase
MRVVTSGSAYIDIDAYAGCVAYAELLGLQGIEAVAASTAPWNESITQTVRSWQADIQTDYNPAKDDTFTLIDVSDLDYFDPTVDAERVDEIIDHHTGFEAFWKNRIGNRAQIEFIGAACTLVYERWVQCGELEKMSSTSAHLLATGILDNTLNFKAHVTTERDQTAYKDLARLAGLGDDWSAQYFSECQQSIIANIEGAIRDDSKTLRFKGLAGNVCFGQLVVWDARGVIKEHFETVERVLSAIKPGWFMNVVSVEEGRSYFMAKDPVIKNWLQELLRLDFKGDVAVAGRLWLRKEVIILAQKI